MKKSSIVVLSIFSIIFSLIIVILHNPPTNIFRESGLEEVDDGYKISQYDVYVEVQLDNSYSVHEIITVKFGEFADYGPSYGFFRYIPRTAQVVREKDGKYEKDLYGIDLLVYDAYIEGKTLTPKVYLEEDQYIFEFREPFSVHETTQKYHLHYNYKVGYDRIEEYDDFYFNLLGNFWDTSIENFSFEVSLPKPKQMDSPVFYYGPYGSPNEAENLMVNIENVVTIDGTKTLISGFSTSKISPYYGVTIRLQMEEGYFSEVQKFNENWDYFIIALLGILTIIIIIVSLRKRDNQSLVIPVEFYPPDGIDPVNLLYTLDGFVLPQKMTSLIIYWASKGYLKIIDEDDNISLQKLKNLENSAPTYQKKIFNAIFVESTQRAVSDIVDDNLIKELDKSNNLENKNNDLQEQKISIEDLGEKVGESFFTARTLVSSECGTRIERKSIFRFLVLMVLMFLPLLSYLLLSYIRMNIISSVILKIILLIPLLTIATSIYNFVFNKNSKLSQREKILLFILLVPFIVLAFKIAYLKLSNNIFNKFNIQTIIAIATVINIYFISQIIRFNEKTKIKIGRILGFKNNLEKVEKNRIKVLLRDDPSYFYDILPYAYVLGITDEYSKKFEGLAIEPPSWYINNQGYSMFSAIYFTSIVTKNINSSINKAITNHFKTIASSNMGGIGRGGGFSGGGFGGGGGGRIR